MGFPTSHVGGAGGLDLHQNFLPGRQAFYLNYRRMLMVQRPETLHRSQVDGLSSEFQILFRRLAWISDSEVLKIIDRIDQVLQSPAVLQEIVINGAHDRSRTCTPFGART